MHSSTLPMVDVFREENASEFSMVFEAATSGHIFNSYVYFSVRACRCESVGLVS